MGKLDRIRRYVVAEMQGKVGTDRFGLWKQRTDGMWAAIPTVNYAKNDVDLFRAIFFASVYNGKGKEYVLGAFGGKKIVNSSAAFTIGRGCSVKLGVPNQERTQELIDAEEEVNAWLSKRTDDLFNWSRHAQRDGDAYLYINELGEIDELDARTVEIMLDPITSALTGFDVTENVEEVDADGNKNKYRIVKQYRRDSIRYFKETGTGAKRSRTTIYERVFTDSGPVDPNNEDGTRKEFVDGQLMERPLPLVHLPNEPEPRAVYGNSEYQNLLNYMANYHAVLAEGTKGVIYNSTPVPWLKGVKDPSKLATDSHAGSDDAAEDRDKIRWGQDTALLLEGDNAAAGMLQANALMPDVEALLKLYFYAIVEASETPEFVFGTAMQSSRASTETQVPVVFEKAETKRRQMTAPIGELVKAWIDRQAGLANPAFTGLRGQDIEVTVEYPSLGDEDKKLNQDTLDMLHDRGVVSDETYLRLSSIGDKVEDRPAELEQARADQVAAVDRANAAAEQATRTIDEANAT